MLEVIDKIIFIEKNAFCEPNYFEIDISPSTSFLKLKSMKETIIATVNQDTLLDFLENLFRIIVSWDKEYIGDHLSENSEWKLVIQSKDHSLDEYCGENSYPINFDKFKELKNKLLDSVKGSIL